MKIFFGLLIAFILCILLPCATILLIITSPFIFTYFLVKLFKNSAEIEKPKKETSFFDFAIKHVLETKKNTNHE